MEGLASYPPKAWVSFTYRGEADCGEVHAYHKGSRPRCQDRVLSTDTRGPWIPVWKDRSIEEQLWKGSNVVPCSWRRVGDSYLSDVCLSPISKNKISVLFGRED